MTLTTKKTILCLISSGVLASCADPVTTPSSADPSSFATSAGKSVAGFYELNFLNSAHQPVTSLAFGQAVRIQAVITDQFGQPAQGGSVAFQYCSLRGYPTDDITRIDETPFEACDVTGAGRWRTLGTTTVNSAGTALYIFCCPQLTPTIGFRFKYSSQGSGIKDHTSPGENMNWS